LTSDSSSAVAERSISIPQVRFFITVLILLVLFIEFQEKHIMFL
jgi:hypothetical protein